MPEYGARSLVEEAYQCLDNHLNYWSYIGTEPHQRSTYQFLTTYGKSGNFDPRYPGSVKKWTELEERAWDSAQTIVLDPEVHRIVSEAAESMPESPFDVSLLPTPAGVLMLPDLGEILNYVSPADAMRGDDLPVAAIAWCVANDIGVVGEDGVDSTVPGVQLWVYTGAGWRAQIAREKGIELDPAIARTPFHIIDMTPWAGGRTWQGVPYYKAEVNEGWNVAEDGSLLTDPHVAILRRFLMALWVFMAEEIVALPKQQLPRSLRRRVERQRPDVFEGMLRIAQLRKMKYLVADREADPDAEPVQWSHRWWVKGHQRKLASGEVTYVRPHIKGPADKPLVLKNDIVAVRR